MNPSNHIRGGRGNYLHYRAALLKGVDIEIHGKNNSIFIEDLSGLIDCRIRIYEDDNDLCIGAGCCLEGGNFWMEDHNNRIEIGDHTFFHGDMHIAVLESTSVTIGKDCLFARDVQLRTGDSHSILDGEGKRINPAADIMVGDHCWFGTRILCLKGTEVLAHTVVGAGALLSRKYETDHCILAGVPAKVVKEGIDWVPECVPVSAEA